MNGARLIYLMGASGSGRTPCCVCCAQLRADEPVIVAHRYITRDSGASEDALRLSEDEFSRREALAVSRCVGPATACATASAWKWMPGWPAARRSSSTVRAHTCLRRMRAILR